MLGGVLADYLGSKQSVTLAILAYALLTGLSALSWDWLSFAAFRFLVGSRSARNGRLGPRSRPSHPRLRSCSMASLRATTAASITR